MEYENSAAAKALRRLDLGINHGQWSGGVEDGLSLALVRLAGLELPREDMAFLTGPFLIAEDCGNPPEWAVNQATAERYEIVVEKRPLIVGPAEIATTLWVWDHLMLQTDPCPAELTELYLWAAVALQARFCGRDAAVFWPPLGREAIADSDVVESSGRLWPVYEDLAMRIRRRVIRIVFENEEREQTAERRRKEWANRPPTVRQPRPGVQVPMFSR